MGRDSQHTYIELACGVLAATAQQAAAWATAAGPAAAAGSAASDSAAVDSGPGGGSDAVDAHVFGLFQTFINCRKVLTALQKPWVALQRSSAASRQAAEATGRSLIQVGGAGRGLATS